MNKINVNDETYISVKAIKQYEDVLDSKYKEKWGECRKHLSNGNTKEALISIEAASAYNRAAMLLYELVYNPPVADNNKGGMNYGKEN